MAPPDVVSQSKLLHLPTMFVMILVASAVLAAAMAVIAGRRHRDLQAWSLGLLAQAVSYVLLSLRGDMPELAAVVLPYIGISCSIALYIVGVFRIHRIAVPLAKVFGPVVVAAVVFPILIDDYHLRLVAGAIIWMSQTLHLIVVVWRFRLRIPGRGQYVVAGAAALFAVTEFFRLFSVLYNTGTSHALTTPTPQSVGFFLSSMTCTILLAIGALTMVQERAEQALLLSEARHRKVIETATVGIFVVSGGVFRFINPKGAELLGRSPQAIVGQPLFPFVFPDDRVTAHRYQMERSDKTVDDLRYQLRMMAGDRGFRWMEISGVDIDWQGQKATLNFLTDVTERHQIEEHMREMAWHDALTHLPNRRLFVDHLQLALANSERSRRYGAVLFFDLDNFKPLNDKHGHALGDLLLIEVAKRLLQCIRPSDTGARFGGDEFVVLLTDLAESKPEALRQANERAEAIRHALGQPYRLRGQQDGRTVEVTHHCSATGGIALFCGSDVHGDVLIERADAAMYQAKEGGRNRVRLAQSGLVA